MPIGLRIRPFFKRTGLRSYERDPQTQLTLSLTDLVVSSMSYDSLQHIKAQVDILPAEAALSVRISSSAGVDLARRGRSGARQDDG